jgi:hypothetical protein
MCADLADVLGALIATPVSVQMQLDAHWDRAITLWHELVQHTVRDAPPAWRGDLCDLLSGAAPTRQVLSSFEVEYTVRLQIDRERRVTLWGEPVQLGWEKLFRETRESASRITVHVDRVALPAVPAGWPPGTESPSSSQEDSQDGRKPTHP